MVNSFDRFIKSIIGIVLVKASGLKRDAWRIPIEGVFTLLSVDIQVLCLDIAEACVFGAQD